MSKSSSDLTYLVKATGDHYLRQLRYNRHWEKKNPERRKLTVNKSNKRRQEREQQRKARVAAYLAQLEAKNHA